LSARGPLRLRSITSSPRLAMGFAGSRRVGADCALKLIRSVALEYFADHIKHADDGEYWYRANVNRHAASVAVPMLHVSSW
jgi:predicted acyl esterase